METVFFEMLRTVFGFFFASFMSCLISSCIANSTMHWLSTDVPALEAIPGCIFNYKTL